MHSQAPGGGDPGLLIGAVGSRHSQAHPAGSGRPAMLLGTTREYEVSRWYRGGFSFNLEIGLFY